MVNLKDSYHFSVSFPILTASSWSVWVIPSSSFIFSLAANDCLVASRAGAVKKVLTISRLLALLAGPRFSLALLLC